MSKKVYIGVGHGGSDPGAVSGKHVESKYNLDVAKACYNHLKECGVNVKISRTDDTFDSITDKVNEANKFGADLALDVHHNAGGGDGGEVFHSINGGVGKTLASNIDKEMIKIGQNSRGIKTKKGNNGDYFGFIRLTNMPAVLIECAFVDNTKDVKIVDTLEERKKMGIAIAKGVLKTLGITEKQQVKKPAVSKPKTDSFKVRVSISNLNIRKGAGYKKYASVGMCPKGTYTIVETKSADGFTWGKLKSGAGWIALEYTERV